MESPQNSHIPAAAWPANVRFLSKWVGRLTATLCLTALFAGSQAMAEQAKLPANIGVRNIVPVHGALTDGSSWSPIIPRLQAMGHHVTAVQNPLTSLTEDVATTERALRRQDGGVLLVGTLGAAWRSRRPATHRT